MKREIVLDTETTGLKHDAGDRIVEIGCIELINHLPTGRSYQTYINPQCAVSEGASRISGLTTEFLKPFPVFAQIIDPFLEFIEDSPLVIHNAKFDMGFLNMELKRLCRTPFPYSRAIDTLDMARRKFPGSPASLDALCKRFGIDNTNREKHGALIDTELLAQVYLELIGGRQTTIQFRQKEVVQQVTEQIEAPRVKAHRAPRSFPISAEEQGAHEAFVAQFK